MGLTNYIYYIFESSHLLWICVDCNLSK